MSDLKTQRRALRISLSAMARMAAVSRYRLANSELGGDTLTSEEEQRIRNALRSEAARLAAISYNLSFEGRPYETVEQ